MKKIFLCLLGVSLLIGITGCGTSDSLNGKWIATTENQNIYQVNEDGDELGGKEDYILECDGNGNYTLTLENNQTKKGTYARAFIASLLEINNLSLGNISGLFQKGHFFFGSITIAANGNIGIHYITGDKLDVCTGAASLYYDEDSHFRIVIGGIAHEQTVVLDVFTLLGSTGLAGYFPFAVHPVLYIFGVVCPVVKHFVHALVDSGPVVVGTLHSA